MKLMICAAVVSTLYVGSVFAAEQMWTGAISDKMCGVSHKTMAKKMTDRECTQACARGGAPYQFVSDGKVYQLMNHDAELRTHAGHTVSLTGELKGDAIRVSKIEMTNTSK